MDQPREVLIEVTYQLRVPLVTAGRYEKPIKVRLQRDATQLVQESIDCLDLEEKTMLGKAFAARGLDPMEAVRIRISSKVLTTLKDRLTGNRGVA